MGSFSAPRALQLLVTTEEPITPSSIERDQKLWEDKINPQVWDQGIPGRAHQAEPVIIVLPSLSFERVLFPVRKPSGISEDNDDRFSLVGSSRNPLVPHLGVNFVFP